MKSLCLLGLLSVAVVIAGCKTEHRLTVDPVPIHVTMDVNIKVQKDLEEFFDFEDMFEDVAAEDAEEGTR